MFSTPSRKLATTPREGNPPILVIGAGIAGLQAALIAARRSDVLLISAADVDHSNSSRAQGGIAAAIGPDDTTELHVADTLKAGRGLCRPSAVHELVAEAPDRIQDLRDLGADFEDDLGLEGGHSRNRIVHAGGAATGSHVSRVLAAAVDATPGITIQAGTRVRGIWVEDGTCVGVLTTEGGIAGSATILATGGAGGLWSRTTNAPTATGGGIAAAYNAGAEVADMEFTQFHPTALVGTSLLLSEALRGAGATLLDDHGQRFVDELAPRDVVARAINDRAGTVTLDLRSIDRGRFNGLMEQVQAESGLDPAVTPIPVSPAAHYFIGGIVTDLDGQSSLDRLYAAGECSTTGVHGANRLASNSLLECLVFGRRAALHATDRDPVAAPSGPAPNAVSEAPPPQEVKEALWRDAGLVRSSDRLRTLTHSPHTVVRLIADAALMREESRGVHYRSDFPEEDEAFRKHIVQRLGHEPQLVEWT